MTRRFVIVGRRASASPDFSLDDLPGTSGRLDVLLRCLRAGLLVSHSLRADTVVYLVLLGGAAAPRTLRYTGSAARYVRPDERHLAVTVRKALAVAPPGAGFAPVRPGVDLASGGLAAALADCAGAALYALDPGGADVRAAPLDHADAAFVVGDHLGLDDDAWRLLDAAGAARLSVGPVSLHADDAVALVHNELDRLAARR